MSLEKFIPTVSIERLKSFCKLDKVCDEQYLIDLYKVNIKISQAFYPILSAIEITLRNSIDTMLQTVISQTWLEDEISSQNLLLDYDYKSLQDAYSKLLKRYAKGNISRGKIISELNFGFWVNLCSKKYNPKIWTKKGAFRGVFINYPKGKQEQIHELSKTLTQIKNIRNRIFHYEPIINKERKFVEVYKNIKTILSYLPVDGSDILQQTDNFESIVKEVTLELSNKKP